MNRRYEYRLTEELARWALEVQLLQLGTWYIAFTNPTAGPWKRVMANDSHGKRGEVYRFPRDSDRPDLILVSDSLGKVIIIEAKDSLPKLMVPNQMKKSLKVIADLTQILGSLHENEYWGKRTEYEIIPGLLWASDAISEEPLISSCVNKYGKAINKLGTIESKNIFVVEIIKRPADNNLLCNNCMYKKKNDKYLQINDGVTKSLVLNLRE